MYEREPFFAKCQRTATPASASSLLVYIVSQTSAIQHRGQSSTSGHRLVLQCMPSYAYWPKVAPDGFHRMPNLTSLSHPPRATLSHKYAHQVYRAYLSLVWAYPSTEEDVEVEISNNIFIIRVNPCPSWVENPPIINSVFIAFRRCIHKSIPSSLEIHISDIYSRLLFTLATVVIPSEEHGGGSSSYSASRG